MKLNFEKYDKIIWRVNGTLILLGSVIAVLVCALVGSRLVSEVFETRPEHDIVNVNQNTKKEEFLRLGYFQPLPGTDLILVPLTAEQKSNASYYSRSSYNQARNYLIFNAKTKDSYWVWKTNTTLALEETKIQNQVSDGKNQKVIGLVFEFVDKNSNADKTVDENDQKSLQYFDLATRKPLPVVDGVDRVIGVRQSGDDEVLFFYSRAGKSFFKGLTLSAMKLSDEYEIGLQ